MTGADRFYAPGEFGAAPQAICPSGTLVVGTGFSGPFSEVGGFIQGFGTFVGGFFSNQSLITVNAHVQAICATGNRAAVARAARLGAARYKATIAAARR